MRAVVIHEPGSIGIETVADPILAEGQVMVEPRAAGICGTDLHIIDGEFPPAPYPLIPGHELAGEVVDVASDVEGLSVGQRVTVDPSLFCGHCAYCRRQRGNLCQHWGAIGDTVNGGFAKYVAVPARNAYPIPDDMDWAAAALVEPLSCAVHGLRRLSMPPGSDLLIVGAGTMGLLLLQAARVSGAAEISVLDTDPARRQLASKLGADCVGAALEDVLGAREIGFQFAVEATGVSAAADAAVRGLCRGGTMLVFGVAPAQVKLSLGQFQVYNDELTVLGSMAVLNTFEPALRLMASGAINASRMVTETLSLEKFGLAIGAVRERRGLKVQLEP